MLNNSRNTWFYGLKEAILCKDCGYKIIVTVPATEETCDYWWYCSNKGCKNHHPGEQTGDQEEPSFLQKL